MAVAKAAAKAAPRTVSRDEPEARMPDREAPQRDPNKIYTRDGRLVDLARVTNQDNDYSNLPSLGIFPPQGWHYEWHTISIKGAEYTEGIVRDAETGWTPVPASRHDGKLMPRGHTGHIEKGGQRLMECDIRLKAYLNGLRDKEANDRVRNSRQRMGAMVANAAPNSGALLDANNLEAQRGTFFRKVAEPENSGYVTNRNYQYTLDE